VDRGVQNVLYMLELLEERVPVFRVAEALLLAPLKTSQYSGEWYRGRTIVAHHEITTAQVLSSRIHR